MFLLSDDYDTKGKIKIDAVKVILEYTNPGTKSWGLHSLNYC
jgi:hypothetical protein